MVLLRMGLVKGNQQGNAGEENEEGHQEMAVRHNTFCGFQEAHTLSFYVVKRLVSGYVGRSL
jgi:hypothetical protein